MRQRFQNTFRASFQKQKEEMWSVIIASSFKYISSLIMKEHGSRVFAFCLFYYTTSQTLSARSFVEQKFDLKMYDKTKKVELV